MSGSGVVFQVPEDSCNAFASCQSRSDWYGVLGQLDNASKLPQVSLHDSVDSWRELLAGQVGHLPAFFRGEFNTLGDREDHGGPHMLFIGSTLVALTASELSELRWDGRANELFKKKFDIDLDTAWPDVTGRLPALHDFLMEASERKCAVVVLWG